MTKQVIWTEQVLETFIHEANLIELSAKEAGIRVFDTRICRHKYYIFSIPFGGQGNARTRQAEAMAQVMKAAGYDASVYYQID